MREEYLLPENPVPPTNCSTARTIVPRAERGAEEAMALALRDARISLWGDLWQKVERYERENWQLRQQVTKLEGQLARARRRKSHGATRRTTAKATSG